MGGKWQQITPLNINAIKEQLDNERNSTLGELASCFLLQNLVQL